MHFSHNPIRINIASKSTKNWTAEKIFNYYVIKLLYMWVSFVYYNITHFSVTEYVFLSIKLSYHFIQLMAIKYFVNTYLRSNRMFFYTVYKRYDQLHTIKYFDNLWNSNKLFIENLTTKICVLICVYAYFNNNDAFTRILDTYWRWWWQHCCWNTRTCIIYVNCYGWGFKKKN